MKFLAHLTVYQPPNNPDYAAIMLSKAQIAALVAALAYPNPSWPESIKKEIGGVLTALGRQS